MGGGVRSQEMRFSVKTGDIPAVASTGVLEPASGFALKKSALSPLPDGRFFRFIGQCKSSGESYFDYFEQLQLLMVDADFQTSLLNLESIPNPESYTDLQGFALAGDRLVLALYNRADDKTDLYAVGLDGGMLAGPYTVSGSPNFFVCGGKLKTWKFAYGIDEEASSLQIETIDFKNPVTVDTI